MRFVLAATIAILPSFAMAQQTVPPLVTAEASSSARVQTSGAQPSGTQPANGQKVAVPAGFPPAIHPMSPSAPLNTKEQVSARLAETWRNKPEPPHRGPDGVQLWTYGLSQPSIVCSPLQVCDLAIEAGEVVNNINLGDAVRWSVKPAVSGGGMTRVTHLVIKPADAGLVTSMMIYTDRRTYSIKMVSTQNQWTPMTAFTYPGDAASAWEQYRSGAMMGSSTNAGAGGGSNPASLDFGFSITGDTPPWRPDRVYSDGAKTYVHFPHAMKFGSAPALVGLDNDGGWFTSPSEQMVNYRTSGDLYVVDKVLDRAQLVMGVGGSQQKVTIERERH